MAGSGKKMGRPPRPFWEYVDKTDTCWLWVGHLDADGYGRHCSRKAHRVVYEMLVGPIPTGLSIDHLCRVRSCVNPAHLEPVPHRINALRGVGPSAINAKKSKCNRGHDLVGDNLKIESPTGGRRCVTCRKIRQGIGTRGVFNADKVECKYGHPFSGENLYVYPSGRRGCRTCAKAYQANLRAVRNSEASASV